VWDPQLTNNEKKGEEKKVDKRGWESDCGQTGPNSEAGKGTHLKAGKGTHLNNTILRLVLLRCVPFQDLGNPNSSKSIEPTWEISEQRGDRWGHLTQVIGANELAE